MAWVARRAGQQAEAQAGFGQCVARRWLRAATQRRCPVVQAGDGAVSDAGAWKQLGL